RVRRRPRSGGRAAREQELPTRVVVVDRAADGVPDGGHVLPLVDQQRSGPREEALGVCEDALSLGGIVEVDHRGGALAGGGCFADALRAVDRDRGEVGEEFVELGIDHPTYVRHAPRLAVSQAKVYKSQDLHYPNRRIFTTQIAGSSLPKSQDLHYPNRRIFTTQIADSAARRYPFHPPHPPRYT